MIININPVNKNYSPTFSARNSSKFVKLEKEAFKQAYSLKDICAKILTQINHNESLVEQLHKAFENLKISKTALVFSLANNKSIRLAMPRGVNGNLFTMQTLVDKKPENTVIVNESFCLIESFCINKETFITPEKYDKNAVEKTISNIFELTDFPLLKLRMFIKKELDSSPFYAQNGAIVKQNTEKHNTVNKNSITEKQSALNIPTSENWHEYSMAEIVKQNAGKIPVKKTVSHNKYSLKKMQEKRLRLISIREKSEKVNENLTASLKNTNIGFVKDDIVTKLTEIKNLHDEIKNFLKDKCLSTNVKICNGYPDLIKNDNKGFTFKDIKIIFPQSNKAQEEIIFSIKDFNAEYGINITESGKLISNKMEKFNIGRFLEKPLYLSQEKVDLITKEKAFNELIDKTLNQLKDFKNYIDNQGWRVRKDKAILEKNHGFLEKSLLDKVSFIKNKYDNIHELYNSMTYYVASKIKLSYGNLFTAATSRLEFINPLNDGLNIAFDYSKNKYGEFYKIAKHSGKQDVEEMFLITPDGKVVKNIVKNQGLKSPFPTGGNADIRFYSEEELNNINLKELDDILNFLVDKTSDYENFILKSKNSPKTRKKSQNIKNIEETEEKHKIDKTIPYDVVKDFLDKTAIEIQNSVDKINEATGFKNALNSIAEDLKNKFDDFLNKFKT